jgi:hypothetical protein
MNTPFTRVLPLGVSIFLVGWLIWQANWEVMAQVLRQSHRTFLFLAFSCALPIPLLSAVRWLGVLRVVDSAFPFALALRGSMLGAFLNCLLPSKGGDVAKSFVAAGRLGGAAGLGSVVVERLADLVSLGLLGLFAALLGHRVGALGGGLAIAAATIVLSLVLFMPVHRLPARLQAEAGEFRNVAKRWIGSPRNIFVTMIGSSTTWLLGGLVVCCLIKAVAPGAPFTLGFGVYPAAVLAGLLPVAMSGIGVRDAAFAALLANSIGYDRAVLIGLCYTVIAYWFLGLVAAPWVLQHAWKLLRPRSGGNS